VFLLHKTVELTTNNHGKEGAIGSIPVGSSSQNVCSSWD